MWGGVRCEKGRMMWKQGSVEQMADERCGWRIGRKARKQEGEKARKYWGQSPIAPNTLPKSCRKLFFISYCGCRGKEGE